MAGDSNTIRILLTLDGKQYAADLKSAEVQTKALGNSAAGAGTQLSVLRTAALGAAGGLGSIVVAPVVPFLVQSGQEAIRLRERLEAITGSSGAARSEMRSEEHTSELQSRSRISNAVFCLKKKKEIST